jgi:GTP-binding protein
MKITSAEFYKSVLAPSALPTDGVPEIAFAGRSNVGKSTLLNALMQKKLARTSQTPGKTREINYYKIRCQPAPCYFIDLPGYGYAKVSKSEQESWKKLLEAYLKKRTELKLVLLLVDSRHPELPADLQMQEFLYFYGRRFAIVRTKTDKLSQSELIKSRRASEAFFGDYEFMHDLAAEKNKGTKELLEKIAPFLTQAT